MVKLSELFLNTTRTLGDTALGDAKMPWLAWLNRNSYVGIDSTFMAVRKVSNSCACVRIPAN